MHIALGQFRQETCVNAPRTTTHEAFKIDHGEEIISQFGATKSDLGGFIDVSQDRDDVTLESIFSARSSPGALVADSVFEELTEEMVAELRCVDVDGVILALHGAMLTPLREDPEGELLTMIDSATGNVPIVATVDPHAHITPKMVDTATGIVAYQTNPHVDTYETGRRGMDLLIETVRGAVDPVMSMAKVPTMIAIQRFYEYVKQLENDYEEVLHASYINVQTFFDAEDMGHGGLIITDSNVSLANELAEDLARDIWNSRTEGSPTRPSGRPSVTETLQRVVDNPKQDPYVLLDDGDHMCAGAPGDSPVFLRELLADEDTAQINASIQIVDPAAVECLFGGHTGLLPIGGKLTPGFSPVVVSGEVEAMFEEPLVADNELSAGTEDFFGRRVSFAVADSNVRLVLTEDSGRANDPNFFLKHGIDPEEQDLVVIQCFHNLADYESIAAEIIRVKSPGVTATPYDFLRKSRPIYPLDEPDPTFNTFDGYWNIRR